MRLSLANLVGELKRDDNAKQIWHKVYPDLSDGKPGLLGAVIARAEAQVMRLACIYALLDCSNIIRAEHLKAGPALWEYAENSARYIFGDSLGDPVADTIPKAVRQVSPRTKTDISNLLGRHVSASRIDEALGNLQRRELVYCEVTLLERGGKIVNWYAIEDKGKKWDIT